MLVSGSVKTSKDHLWIGAILHGLVGRSSRQDATPYPGGTAGESSLLSCCGEECPFLSGKKRMWIRIPSIRNEGDTYPIDFGKLGKSSSQKCSGDMLVPRRVVKYTLGCYSQDAGSSPPGFLHYRIPGCQDAHQDDTAFLGSYIPTLGF